MNILRESARAKINFVLNVGEKCGQKHELDTLIVPIDLFDEIALQKRTDGKVVVSYDGIPDRYEVDPAKALAKKIVEKYALPGVTIEVKKNIPERAGLGGSSTDAAAVARGMEKLFCFGKIDRSLLTETGSDVYAAYLDTPCRVRGTGEKAEPVDLRIPHLLLVFPTGGVSTAECYAAFDRLGGERGDVDEIIAKMRRGEEFAPKNALLRAAESLCPEIGTILERLRIVGLSCGMTGSGSAMFAFGYDKEKFLEKIDRLGDVGTRTILFRE